MQNELNQYYINLLKEKYTVATKSKKTEYLDEAELFTKLSRKRIIKKLGEKFKKDQTSYLKGRPRKFDEIIPHLRMLKSLMGNISEKRIKAAIPIWLPFYRKHFNLIQNSRIEVKLRTVSASTISRLIKRDLGLKGLSTTKPNKKMKMLIPLKKLDEDVIKPGVIQADTVAHCGTCIAGKYAHTVTAVDVYSGWTENRAIWTKEATRVVTAVKSIENSFPFSLKNFDTDCGTEFLNYTLMKHLEERPSPIKMRRSRPYKKNDQCYVEQKNFTHVRKIFKYHRIEKESLIDIMNDIYINYWNPLHNYFIPSFKLESKLRVNSKIIKVHEFPKTPAQRIIDCKNVKRNVKKNIDSKLMHLDPIILKKELNKKLAIFTEMLENYIHQIAA
jgi:hypothetical protein